MKNLIKSSELRTLIKNWADYNEIKPDWGIRITRGNWDHGGCCMFDCVVSFYEFNSRMMLTVFLKGIEKDLKHNEVHTLKDLIACKN